MQNRHCHFSIDEPIGSFSPVQGAFYQGPQPNRRSPKYCLAERLNLRQEALDDGGIYTDLKNDPKIRNTAEFRGTAEKFKPYN